VLAESADMKPVAAQVTRYIAERLIERQRMLDGAPLAAAETAAAEIARPSAARSVLRGIGMVLLGGLVGVAVILLVAWERVAEMLARF
jgi:hypothetical protein